MRTRSLEAAKFIALQLEMLFTNPRRADARRSWRCVRRSCGDVRGIVLAGAIREPRRADARRSCWRYSPNSNRTDLQVRFPSHGGLTPAALGAARDGRVGMCAELSSQVRFSDHGGLTPAALVTVRWCIGSDVISSAVEVLFHRQTCTPQHGREGAVSAGHRVGLVRIQAELFHRLGDFPHLDLASTGELIESGQGD